MAEKKETVWMTRTIMTHTPELEKALEEIKHSLNHDLGDGIELEFKVLINVRCPRQNCFYFTYGKEETMCGGCLWLKNNPGKFDLYLPPMR